MNNLNYQILKSAIQTEKSNKDSVFGKYYFDVDSSCNKKQIKSLISSIFSVKVKEVNIINVASKIKRFKGKKGERNSYKKAIVTLEKGSSINIQDLK